VAESTTRPGAEPGAPSGAPDERPASVTAEHDADALRRRCAALEAEVEELRALVARHESFIHQQHREVLRATSDLHLVLRSRSWRLTAPLRDWVAPAKRLATRLRGVARRVAGERAPARAAGPRHAAVLFVSGCPGDAKRYRCDHARERLEALGIACEVALHGQIELAEQVPSFAVIVLHRVPYGPDVEALLRAARRARKPVVFDTDDWVFDVAAMDHVAALADMTPDERALYREGLTRYRTTLSRCDGVLVSTEPLRARAAELVPNAHVVPNVASREMVLLSRAARERRRATAAERRARGELVLGYFSGTPTHRRDFAEAVPAIAELLDADPRARLTLVGHIDVPPQLVHHADRITRLPLVPWQQLPGLMADVDVNLAPLEPDNGFTECKSAIKHLEAALVGVPTVASPLPDFARVVADGENGLLARTGAEWRDALRALAASPELCAELGERALADAESAHTTYARGEETVAALCRAARLGRQTAPLTVTWVRRRADLRHGRRMQDDSRARRRARTSGSPRARARRAGCARRRPALRRRELRPARNRGAGRARAHRARGRGHRDQRPDRADRRAPCRVAVSLPPDPGARSRSRRARGRAARERVRRRDLRAAPAARRDRHGARASPVVAERQAVPRDRRRDRAGRVDARSYVRVGGAAARADPPRALLRAARRGAPMTGDAVASQPRGAGYMPGATSDDSTFHRTRRQS
jgi:glycosyltransferase involved in cell wall biosynthesis